MILDAVRQVIAHAVIEATKSSSEAIMAERGEETIRHRSKEAGIRPNLGRTSATFNFTKEVKNIFDTYKIDQAEKMPVLENSLCRQALIQAEQ